MRIRVGICPYPNTSVLNHGFILLFDSYSTHNTKVLMILMKSYRTNCGSQMLCLNCFLNQMNPIRNQVSFSPDEFSVAPVIMKRC